MQLKIQTVHEFQIVQVCTFKTTFRIGRMTAMAARNSLTVDASVANPNLEWYVGRSCCSLLVPLVRRSLGGIICVASISF